MKLVRRNSKESRYRIARRAAIMDDPRNGLYTSLTRRHFFGRTSTGVGIATLAQLLGEDLLADENSGGIPGLPHFQPTAKRVIYLFQSGGPSQIELFDHKPML